MLPPEETKQPVYEVGKAIAELQGCGGMIHCQVQGFDLMHRLP